MASPIIPQVPGVSLLDGQISELLVLRTHDDHYYIGRLRYDKDNNVWFAVDPAKYIEMHGHYDMYSYAYTVLLSIK